MPPEETRRRALADLAANGTVTQRRHSAIDYIAPKDKLEGRAEAILSGREAKLAADGEQRRITRQQNRLNQALKNPKEVAIIA